MFDLAPGARLGVPHVSATRAHSTATCADAAPLACPESRFAIGIGAFGTSDAECRDRFGEFVAVSGAAGYLPGDGTEVPDYLVASDAEAPELRAVRAIACDGPSRSSSGST